MFELVLTVCLLADPAKCHDERLRVLDADITLIQCMMTIPDIVGWQQQHPDWRVSGWQCRPYVPEKDI